MRVCQVDAAVFDDGNLVAHAGLVPLVSLAQRTGLTSLLDAQLSVPGSAGAHAGDKAMCVMAGMAAGADCIEDLDVLRHGATPRLLSGVRAPSTLGTFLRGFTFGHVRQLDAVAARLLARLAGAAPILPGAGAGATVFLDVDDTIKPMHGYAQQGVGYGYTRVKGLNALIAAASTAGSRPVIAATRLRKGSANSARGAGRLVADAIATIRRTGAAGPVWLRMDSAYYGHPSVAAALRAGAVVSVTVRMIPTITTAIAAIPDTAWLPIRYPNAIFDDAEQRWVSDAEVAEVPFTAFTGRRTTDHVPGRLIVRRVKRLSPAHVPTGQGELFTTWRHHAVFTTTDAPLIEAEAIHRGHAIVEQVIADLKGTALAHLPSGSYPANSAWLVLAAMTYNLLRAAGALAGTLHAKATTATIRRHLITVPARVARSARVHTLHLPTGWRWEHAWLALHAAATGPPPPA